MISTGKVGVVVNIIETYTLVKKAQSQARI